MLSKKHYKIFNCFVILEIIVYANLIPPSHYCSKNLQCFCIVYWKLNILRYLCPLLFPRPKVLVVRLFRNDDQTWEVKGEKRTSENRRKINGLKASKNWDVNGNFLSEFFLSSYRNFQTIPSVPPRMAFFYRKNSTVTRRSLQPCLKKSKGPMNVLNSGLLVRLRFKNMRVLNKCLTLRYRVAFSFLLVCN